MDPCETVTEPPGSLCPRFPEVVWIERLVWLTFYVSSNPDPDADASQQRRKSHPPPLHTYSVWKPSDQRSSYIVFHDRPRFWLSKYSLNRRIDFYRQIVPQTFFTFFVELNGPDKFSLSIRMKRVSH